jgi:NodT family efflux transporter outer membrane factor (OMF) lipoprotein
MRDKILTTVVVACLIVSCKIPEATQVPAVKNMPDKFDNATDTSSIANLSWRKFFTDAHLVALIDTALKNNPDLAIAMQRIQAARAHLYLRQTAFYPSLNGVVSAGMDRFGDYTMNGVGNFDTNLSPNIKDDQKIPRHPTPDFFVGLRSNWEIDLWGKLKNQKKAAFARMLASEKGRQFAITNIVATVASLYYELLALDNELEIVRKNIVLQEEALEVVKVQKEGGRATELAVQQFSAQLLNTKAIEYNIRQQLVEIENQLNELLGRYPQSIARDTSLMHQQLPANMQTGTPSQLLVRRPDIQQAEFELQATRADVAAARAAFLPSLNLSPYAGFHSFKAGLLFDPGSIAYGVAAGLSAPLINRRAIIGELNIANVQRNEALFTYQKTLLASYKEVVTNLKSIENNTQSFNLKHKEVEELTNAVVTAKELYLAGYANYLEVITAQKGVLEAELQLTQNKKQLFLTAISLYRSLGGGWD